MSEKVEDRLWRMRPSNRLLLHQYQVQSRREFHDQLIRRYSRTKGRTLNERERTTEENTK